MNGRYPRWITTVAMIAVVPALNACFGWDDGDCCIKHKPIYLDYQTLRDSVQVVEPEPIESLNRLYLYDNYIFLVERNRGFHVIDNSDATNPVNVAFVNVPGNSEISIRDGYVYVDSYVDLVTLDARDASQIIEVDREQGIFPWDAYQNIDDENIYLYDLDPEQGVVVGYREG